MLWRRLARTTSRLGRPSTSSNTAPPPGGLCTRSAPSCASAIQRTIDRPRPVESAVPAATPSNGAASSGWCIPGPLSATITRPSATVTVTVAGSPGRRPYLRALVDQVAHGPLHERGVGRHGGRLVLSRSCAPSACGVLSTTLSTSWSSRTGWRRTCSTPAATGPDQQVVDHPGSSGRRAPPCGAAAPPPLSRAGPARVSVRARNRSQRGAQVDARTRPGTVPAGRECGSPAQRPPREQVPDERQHQDQQSAAPAVSPQHPLVPVRSRAPRRPRPRPRRPPPGRDRTARPAAGPDAAGGYGPSLVTNAVVLVARVALRFRSISDADGQLALRGQAEERRGAPGSTAKAGIASRARSRPGRRSDTASPW